MSDKFEVTWEAEDGYCGGSRPHHLTISPDDFDVDDDENALRKMFWDQIQVDFEQKVNPFSDQEAEFIAWAKEQQERMGSENE